MEIQTTKPMTFFHSLWYFVISSLLIYIGLYHVIPILQTEGMPFFEGYLFFFHFPFFLMFLTALFLYRKEGNAWNPKTFTQRMRLTRLKKSDWLWILGIISLYFLLAALTTPIMNSLAQQSLFSPPSFFPAEINPNKVSASGYMMDYAIAGKYWIPFAYFAGWLANILGEEFLWRGIILPRQIKKYGSKAWIIHGLTWGLWHYFWKWQLVFLIPFALFLSYAAYKSKNTWVGIIGHGTLNFVPLIMIIMNLF